MTGIERTASDIAGKSDPNGIGHQGQAGQGQDRCCEGRCANACIERFNRTYRDELLKQHLFASLDDAREATYWWMIEYNEDRPHDSLGDLTPLEAREKLVGNSTFNLSA